MTDSLRQYLELYDAHKELIFNNSPHSLNRLRDEAYRNLKVTGLPKRGRENYEVSDIPAMLAPDYGLNIARIPLDVDPRESFKCGIPHLSSSLFFMLNDRWAESRGLRANLPEGVEVGPLSRVPDPKFYGTIADLANPIVAFNTMLVQEGVYIHVKKGVKVERPLQLVNILDGTMPMMALRRLLIVVEEDAEVKLLSCSHSSGADHPMASVSVAEIYAAANSRIDFYDMEESNETDNRLTALYLWQEEGSDVLIENFTLHNGKTRNEYYCTFRGPHASLRLNGMGIEGKNSVLDNYSVIRHDTEHCHTEELFKYILGDESRGSFDGLIYVAPGARGTEAYQSNRNMVDSSEAKMFSKPQLEIYNDDVKCSHGSATGQLDPMQLFYLRSRGLSEESARHLLKQAFMADVIEGVRLSLLKDRLYKIVERRFSGEDITCSGCDMEDSSCAGKNIEI